MNTYEYIMKHIIIRISYILLYKQISNNITFVIYLRRRYET